jgi:hypothetical protein
LIGAGTIINPILKIVTTVAVLGAVYIFIVKPVLDTTENITSNVSKQTQRAFADADKASDDFDLNFAKDRAESFASSLRTQWPEAAREVTNCVREADKDAKAMQKCDDFGHELITEGQSPRNFSLSYADSLAAQGNTAAAAQVENCVDNAGFNVRDLQRCRDLADRLLFG